MIDYIVSGTVVGGLIRLRLGPPAAVVGATLGKSRIRRWNC